MTGPHFFAIIVPKIRPMEVGENLTKF